MIPALFHLLEFFTITGFFPAIIAAISALSIFLLAAIVAIAIFLLTIITAVSAVAIFFLAIITAISTILHRFRCFPCFLIQNHSNGIKHNLVFCTFLILTV